MTTVRLVTVAPAFNASEALKLTLLPTASTACYILPMHLGHQPASVSSPLTVAATVAKTAESRQATTTTRLQPRLCPKGTKELLRCKRRIDFATLGYTLPRPHLASVARRNERERNRVKQVNQGFARLRQHVPEGSRNKKLSKVDTLKAAVSYIKRLQETLNNADAISAMFAGFPTAECHQMVDAGSPLNTEGSSGSASPPLPATYAGYNTDGSSSSNSEHFNADDLLDFVSWLQ